METIYEISYEGMIAMLTPLSDDGTFASFQDTSITEQYCDEEGNHRLKYNPKCEPSRWTTSITHENIEKGIAEKRYATSLDEAMRISSENHNKHYPEGRVWSVVKYWDDYPDKIMDSGLSFKEAEDKRVEYLSRRGRLDYYEVRANFTL